MVWAEPRARPNWTRIGAVSRAISILAEMIAVTRGRIVLFVAGASLRWNRLDAVNQPADR